LKAYVLTVLSASIAAAMVEMLSPKGEGGRIAAHVRMIAGLFLMVALLKPLGAGIAFLKHTADGDLSDLMHQIEEALPDGYGEDYAAVFDGTLADVSRAEVEAFVVSALGTVFGVSPQDCAVEAVCDAEEGTVTLLEVRIALCGGSLLKDPHPIESYVASQLGCPCYVTVQL